MSLDVFVQLVFNVHEAHTVGLYTVDEDHLSCISAVSFAKSFDKTRPLSLDGTLAGWVVKHREPLIIGNFDKDEETLGYYSKKEEIKSFMAYPLETEGVIVIDSKKRWTFTDKEKKILAHFVTVLSLEVEREKRLRHLEEEREELILMRREIGFLRRSRPGALVMEEMLKEALAVSGGDLAVAGVERNGRLSVVGAAGQGAQGLLNTECPMRMTVASTVLEGGKELLLPFESGFLREKPLLFQNDGLRAKQYFGFPFLMDEKPFGFLGFASLSARPLRESSIARLADTAVLMALFLSRLRLEEEMEARASRDPATGASRFSAFFDGLNEMARQRKGFSVVSVKLLGFGMYNRSFGVAQGDDILRKIHQSVGYCLGKGAIVTRSEGAHFYAALAGSDAFEESQNILNILRFTILNSLATPKKDVEVGIAHFPKDGEDLWGLLQIAEDRGRKNSL